MTGRHDHHYTRPGATFADYVVYRSVEIGTSWQAVSRELGIPYDVAMQIESGARIPKRRQIEVIHDRLGGVTLERAHTLANYRFADIVRTLPKNKGVSRKALRERVIAKTGGRCWYCGVRSDRMTVDHIVPHSRGGTQDLGNLIPACPACNLEKEDLDYEAFRERCRRGEWFWAELQDLAA